MVRETRRNLLAICVAVGVASAGALGYASITTDIDLKKALQTAALTLVFGGLLGGLVKVLLDDFDRGRQQRAEQAAFLTQVLSDLKGAYDRAERARILLPAHRSVKTYGNEMRDLIDARVRLLNVDRAVQIQSAHGDRNAWNEIRRQVATMAAYLETLVGGFSTYKDISEEQRKYEVLMQRYVEKVEKDPLAAGKPPQNTPWQEINGLPGVQDFLGTGDTNYKTKFLASLDEASKLITAELRKILK